MKTGILNIKLDKIATKTELNKNIEDGKIDVKLLIVGMIWRTISPL
jgi:hypothetical protein